MRYVNQNLLKPDAAWDERARLASAAVSNGAKVSSYSQVWHDAKGRLKDLLDGKCWYCESRQNRADNAVDHFRPKSLYPWSAFDIKNFRYSCTFCNSSRKNPETGETQGKADAFPLHPGTQRATTGAAERQERPLLLDPCKATDVGLLDFLESGEPCARYPSQKIRKERAETSIRHYHLDHPELNEERRQLALQLTDWINGADTIYSEIDEGQPQVENAFTALAESICRSMARWAEHSVFARRVVEGHRTKPWVEDLLRAAT